MRNLSLVLLAFLVLSSTSRAHADDPNNMAGYEFFGGSLGFTAGAALGWGTCRLVYSDTNKSDTTAVRVAAGAGQTLVCLASLMVGSSGGAILGGRLGRTASKNKWSAERGWLLAGAYHNSYTGSLLAYSIAGLRESESPSRLVYGASALGAAALSYGVGTVAQRLNPKCGARGFGVASTVGGMLNVIVGIPVAAIVSSDRLNPKVALGMALAPFLLGVAGSIFCG